MDSSPAQVKVVFTTTEDDLVLPEPKRQLLVPADLKRYGLSRILNSESMLNTSSPVPFEFLANGTFLRTSIDEYLRDNGLSFETTLTLQYVRSLLPPVYEASFEHDDWVGGVDLLSPPAGEERLASASYDGLVRVWNPSGKVAGVSPGARGGGHAQRLNAVRWLSPTQLASGGLDRKIMVWDYKEASAEDEVALKPNMELLGHEKSVNSIDVHGASRRILTASSDGRIGLWSASKRSAPQLDPAPEPSRSAKRAKLSSTSAQRGPLAMVALHDDPVTAALFHPHDSTVAYAASQDHTLRTIDLTTQKEVSRLTTMHPLLCAAALPGANLVAAGSSARHVTLLDPREAAATAATAAMTLRGHVNMVVSLAACPDNEYSLVSASHDSTCRVWDLRSVRPATADEGAGGSVSEPVYTIARESLGGKKMPPAGDGAKVLCVAWDKTWGIVSGGEDKKAQINRGRGLFAAS